LGSSTRFLKIRGEDDKLVERSVLFENLPLLLGGVLNLAMKGPSFFSIYKTIFE
jgi:hypothetical protein